MLVLKALSWFVKFNLVIYSPMLVKYGNSAKCFKGDAKCFKGECSVIWPVREIGSLKFSYFHSFVDIFRTLFF